MLRDNIYIHPPSFLFLCLWECDISIEGRRPGHRTEYSAHVFNVKTSPAGSCSIFPQSTWALCPKQWDFLCIHVTGWPDLQSGDPDCCIHTDLPCYNIHPSCADDDGDPGAVFIRIRSIWIWMWTNFGTLVSIFFPTRKGMKMTKASMAVVVIITCILQYIASQRCHFHCDLLPSYARW